MDRRLDVAGDRLMVAGKALTRGRRRFRLKTMEDVTVHELLERADELLDRVAAGETVTITRDGIPFAELRPLESAGAGWTRDEIMERFSQLEPVDLQAFRRDLDALFDWSL